MEIQNYGHEKTYETLCDLLDNQTRVFYSRFGDGDFNIMSGIGGELYHSFSPQLQKELQDSFLIEDEKYMRGVMVSEPIFNGKELGNRSEKDEGIVKDFIEAYHFDREKIRFYSHVMFTYYAIAKQNTFIDFLNKYIRPKKKMFVGSVPKDKIEKLVGKIDYYVQVPCETRKGKEGMIGAYYSNYEWFPQVLKNINKVELVLPAAGMAGRVLAKRLWYMGTNIHCIELGSVVDGAANIASRSIYRRNDNINKLKNLLLKEV